MRVILGFLRELRQTQTPAAKMLSWSMKKSQREDFISEEWQEFIACYQQILSLEYSLAKLKCGLHEWVSADVTCRHSHLNNLIQHKKL